MEDRISPASGLTGYAVPGVELLGGSAASPSGGAGQPSGFSPAQIRQAYGFNGIVFNGGVQGDGSGQTIAIVDAYSQPNIGSDLQTFDATYGLPSANLTVVNENGGTNLPAANQQWGLEITLDVEWAHAIAPGANILLVEANSSNYDDLMTGVNYARNQPNVSVVSMSWGGGEWSNETSFDSYFTTPAGHKGVTFIAASGDGGSASAPIYSSASPNVLAVGGTQLTTDSSGNYLSEIGWSGSGGGLSSIETQPSYQRGVVTQTGTQRATPDVAYNGSGNSPYAIYDTYSYGGWLEVYGTSAGAPQWSALLAIANQGRALSGQDTLDGATQTLPMLYQLPQSDFHDVTSGSNGAYSAASGYDLVTGRGSPIADRIIDALIAPTGGSSNGPHIVVAPSASANPAGGTTTALSVRGDDAAGAANLIYSWAVLTMPAGAAAPTASVNVSNAAQNTLVTFHAAGVYIFQVTIADPAGFTTSGTLSVTVNPTLTSVLLAPNNANVNDGTRLQFTATALDQFGHAMTLPSNGTWLLSGGGSLNANGLYTAPANGTGTAVVEFSIDGINQSVTLTFAPPPAQTPSDPWSLWFQLLNSWLTQLTAWNSVWQILSPSNRRN